MNRGSRVEVTYHLHLGSISDPIVREYHRRLQPWLLFYIDRSSFIDETDSVWELLMIFEKTYNRSLNETTWKIVGYVSLYTFFKYPQGHRLRVSQVFILPPYQRRGHGNELLLEVHRMAAERDSEEVNVEDPAPGTCERVNVVVLCCFVVFLLCKLYVLIGYQ